MSVPRQTVWHMSGAGVQPALRWQSQALVLTSARLNATQPRANHTTQMCGVAPALPLARTSMSSSCAARSRTHGAVSFMHLASTLSRDPSSAHRQTGRRQASGRQWLGRRPIAATAAVVERVIGSVSLPIQQPLQLHRLCPSPRSQHPAGSGLHLRPRGVCTGSCGWTGPVPGSWARRRVRR